MLDITDDLITQASQGDLNAFEIIYRKSAAFVYNVAFRIVGRKEDAEDVVQEVFMKIHRNLKDFRFDASYKTWAYRITVNTALNYAKSSSRNRYDSFEEKESINALPLPADSSNPLEENIERDAAQKLLSVLNPEQKVCIVLRSVQGLSYEEIAQTLNIPINTVRTRIKRAREAMLKSRSEVMQNEM